MQPSPQAQQNQQPYYQQPPQSQTVNFRTSQSTPTTPTALNRNFDFPVNDSNNNPMRDDRKVFGVQNRGPNSQPIQPMGNHGVQPALNEKRVFGLNVRQRFNSISSDRDWNEALPIVNIPNTDQLLPSQTRQMQTYINQTPPTEKNLRPSLASLQRRKIRPMWPPPSPRINRGTFAEGRAHEPVIGHQAVRNLLKEISVMENVQVNHLSIILAVYENRVKYGHHQVMQHQLEQAAIYRMKTMPSIMLIIRAVNKVQHQAGLHRIYRQPIGHRLVHNSLN
ncbi:hypothetical protein SSS_06043 [Sarcoptes scabiei]|nr:hypothetical protein SSS_06043 [Sarcoptes scabiei]